jgi:hypothetical protein
MDLHQGEIQVKEIRAIAIVIYIAVIVALILAIQAALAIKQAEDRFEQMNETIDAINLVIENAERGQPQ